LQKILNVAGAIILATTVSILMPEVLLSWFHLESMAAGLLYVAGKDILTVAMH